MLHNVKDILSSVHLIFFEFLEFVFQKAWQNNQSFKIIIIIIINMFFQRKAQNEKQKSEEQIAKNRFNRCFKTTAIFRVPGLPNPARSSTWAAPTWASAPVEGAPFWLVKSVQYLEETSENHHKLASFVGSIP